MFLSNLKKYIFENIMLKEKFNEESFNRLVARIFLFNEIKEKQLKSYFITLINIFKGYFEVDSLIAYEILIDNIIKSNNNGNKNTYIKL